MSPYYSRVPKTLEANLRYRMTLLERCAKDEGYRQAMWQASAEDILFWINSFCFIFEPRADQNKKQPWITWDYQDETILTVLDAITQRKDVGWEKSRDMGVTWAVAGISDHFWLFGEYESMLAVSRTEDLVDSTEDPKTIMWKMDFIRKNLPPWMVPRMNRKNLHIQNYDRENTIDGSSTTGDVGRGDRRRFIFMDEMAAFQAREGKQALASTQSVADTRIVVSTYKGAFGAFYDFMHNPEGDFVKIRTHWSVHPLKNPGLYTSERVGNSDRFVLKILDKQYQFPPDYPFILDGKLRSPWYDKECKRMPYPEFIAQELDIDPGGSQANFFYPSLVDAWRRGSIPPLAEGEFDYLRDSLEPAGFTRRKGGPLRLWFNLTPSGGMPKFDLIVIGGDVSQGTGASNSVLSISNGLTGEKIGEYVTNTMDPKAFGRLAVALARWFWGAHLIWEANGPGRGFGDGVLETGYGNFYKRREEETISKKTKDVPGWFSSSSTKPSLLMEYRHALMEGRCVNRCKESADEAAQYIYDGNTISHSKAIDTLNETDAGDSHGDRVIADALAWKACKEKQPTPKNLQADPPKGSLAWTRRERERKEAEAKALSWNKTGATYLHFLPSSRSPTREAALDVEDRKHLHRLYQHLASSRRRLEVFRSNRVKALREYVGRNYSEDGTSDHVMLNLIQQAVRIYSSLLASQNPKAAVYTKYRQLKPSAKNMSLALDHLIEEVDFETTLRQVVHDALFSYGVVVTGVCDYRQVEIDGYTHDYGQPYADYVEAEDYVLDMRAKREDQCRFKGHRYRMLYEDARNHADFDPEAKELLTPTSRFLHNEQGDDRAETISRGNAFDLDDTEDYVELWDLWLPRENVIVTLAAGDDGNSEANSPPLRIRPWTGPERGPYHMLGFIYVPGQLLPAAPVQHWIEIHQLVNRLSNKLGGQADRQKTFTAGSRSGAEDADRVVKTVDGGCYTFDDPDKIKEVSTGGIDPRTMGYVLQLKDWFNTSAGNLEVLGGLGSQADTATQEQLLAGSAARPVADMQAAVHKFTRRVLKTWAHLLWYDPLIQIPLVKRIPGTTLDVYSTWPYQMLPDGREVDLREGDFLDYNFDIQPYSTEQQTPAAQLQKLRTLVNEFLLPLMPIMQQQGTIPDAAALLRAYARYTNMHDLEELMIFLQAPSQEQPVQPLHQSPITRRENVRINKPGATRQGHDQTMIQLLMGGRPQGAEMAGLARGAM